MDMTESLLRAILMTVGRTAFRPKDVYRIVTPYARSEKNLKAYNLCDGRTPQHEIAQRAKLDKGQLSRAITKWIEAGVVVRVGDEELPLHVYPLSKDSLEQTGDQQG
jgi:predicted transcriptional regulator